MSHLYFFFQLKSCRFHLNSLIQLADIEKQNFHHTESVGKSSLISTFVSRYFAEVVPALMTRVRLPPDPATHCVATLVDSQHGDAALVQLLTTRQWQEQQMHQRGMAASTSTNSLQAFLEASSGTVGPPTSTTPTASKGTASGPASTAGTAAGTPMARSETSDAASTLAEQADSIILVYDLDRVETFFRLESHWLPLLERCYQGKVSLETEIAKFRLQRILSPFVSPIIGVRSR